jgi:glycosyltransferase involved in cell wall biosynthesis
MAMIFIECGTSMASPFNTGIQRVVRNIVRESETMGSLLGHQCIQVSFIGRDFHLHEQTAPLLGISRTSWKIRFFRFGVKVYRSIKHLIPLSIHKKILQGVTALERIRQSWGKKTQLPLSIREILSSQISNKTTSAGTASPPILLLLDSTWNMGFWPAVDKFRAAGGHVSAVLYDLIPFTHPDTVEEHTRKAHTSWWLEAPMHLDSVICISKTVRDQYLLWQGEKRLVRRLLPEQVGYFYLGSELNTDHHDGNDKIDIVPGNDPYFLVVGSIEPRKNHAVILDAFDELWSQDIPVNLTIVGSHGWKSEALLKRVANHPMLDKRLFLFRSTTDTELAQLYSKTAGLIIASIAEGFGLPIVEAFQRGAQVICSDIPVFKEIAGQRAIYFDPSNHTELAGKLSTIAQNTLANPSRPRDQASWLTWHESTAQLLHQLVHQHESMTPTATAGLST